MDPSRVAHWQEAWAGAGLARGRRVPGHRKFYALVAYPGSSGFLHVGHLRGYAYADPLHRYHRMLGEEVLLPFGVHASGLPAVTWSRRFVDGDPALLEGLAERGVDAAARARLGDPEEAARFLGREYLRVFRRFGALVDESTFLTTVDEDYRAFIRWQFHALQAAGALVKASYFSSVCPVCGPVAVDASETDLQSGGDAEIVRFTTVPFRLDDGRTLLAATLRPETVFGVTNLWVAPGATLVVWHHDSGTYLVARSGAERLVEQHGGRIGHEVLASDLRNHAVTTPFLGRKVPILENTLVEPSLGTGVVMSVPAHAPADAAALAGLTAEDRDRLGTPPLLIEIDSQAALTSSEEELRAGEGLPAERALRAVAGGGPLDATTIETATERLYRLEFVRGRMTVPPFAGTPVKQAREQVAAQLLAAGASFELQEFTKPVICRNGHTVVIRRIPEQWFLHYSDPAWKAETQELVSRITTWPADYGRELPSILDWFGDRPCTRRGVWLGTRFPIDPEWIIEPIADSTFYMAYFVVRRFVHDGRLRAEDLTDEFFEYVFRGRGEGERRVDRTLQDEVRAEFLYWYPLDFNIGGKEHKRVHFPVFLYTHTRLLPAELQPRGIYVHGWITGPAGQKISKKEGAGKGGKIPATDRAMEQWGPDPLRLYYVVAASPSQDFEFDASAVDAAQIRLSDIERLVREAGGSGNGPPELDAWLDSVTHGWIHRAREAFDGTDLRHAAEIIYVEVPSLLRRYYNRGGTPGAASGRLARAWTLFLSPITPHLAEELGEGHFPGLVAQSLLPTVDEFHRSRTAEARESFLDQVEADLRAVLRASEGRGEPTSGELIFYVAEPWKATLESWLREGVDRNELPTVRDIMTRSKDHPELSAHRAEIPKYVERVGGLLRSEPVPEGPAVDEVATLRAAEGYLIRRFGFRSVAVYRESEAQPHDPKGRRERARPGRPAFFLVGRSTPATLAAAG
ncbi:MAG: class I tRNA ligase family protein [Thermoplasmata archaeon]|nr:class I tRNA ligase family protein [Thermoplasmata archaeon]